MKKQLLFLAMILLPLVASAHEFEVKNADGVTIYYNYTNDGTELQVTFRGSKYDSYFDEYTGNVVIPEEVTYMGRTRKVTSIGNYAFYNCSDLISITIPNSVMSIGNRSFYNCYRLQKVIVSDIAAWCNIKFSDYDENPLYYAKHFYSDENTEIKDLVIPNSVTTIGDYTFEYCSGLTSVTISNSVTSIGEFAFSGCSNISSINIDAKNAEYDSRENCNAIIETASNTLVVGCKKSVIPNSVTSIGRYAFQNCSGLTSVVIPNSVTSIGSNAFENCSGLTSVTIPNSVTDIGSYAFWNCI